MLRTIISLAFLSFFISSVPAYSAVFNISSGDVQGFMAALIAADTNGEENTIVLEDGVYSGASTLAVGSPLPLTIVGENPESTIVGGFTLITAGTVTLERLTVRGGRFGGIRNSGTLNLVNSKVQNNVSQAAGPGGGIRNDGTATIINSTISNNSTGDDSGGGIFNSGLMKIVNSAVHNNHAAQSRTLTNVGGGIWNRGTLEIVNSTIARNGSADPTLPVNGGGIANLTILPGDSGILHIRDSTIAENNAGRGAGIFGSAQLENTIIARNTTTGSAPGAPDCAGALVSLGYNLIENTTGCNIQAQNTDLLDVPSGLDDFIDEGFPGGAYIKLTAKSPAVDSGAPNCSEFDQLGKPRVGQCDRGAIEFQLVMLSASPLSIPVGGTLTTTWSGIPSPTSTDWIGIYQPGTNNAAFITWIYVSCSQTSGSPQGSGSCPFVLPDSLAPGTYELRLLANDGFTALGTSNAFTVTSGNGDETTLNVSPSIVSAGQGVFITWDGIASPTSTDWIGWYQLGAPETEFIDWIYVSCSQTAGSPRASGFCFPSGRVSLPPGNYELRLLSNDGFTVLARSNVVHVDGNLPALIASPSTISAGGTVTATWSRIGSPSSTDWIGLYEPGSANTSLIDWIYVSCSQTAGSPQAAGSCPFVLPDFVSAGNFELRLFSNDGFAVLATSNSFSVE